MEHPDEKKQHIVELALRRFAHFGIHKTTMNEVAEDLGISKANLYYYFPDKTSLVIAAVHLLMQQAKTFISNEIKNVQRTEDALFRILEIKKDYVEKFHMLHLADTGDVNFGDEKIKKLAADSQQQEMGIIAAVLKEGIGRGELVTFDIPKTSELYIETVRGLFLACNTHSMQRDILDKEQLNVMLAKQKEVTHLFINGLKQPMVQHIH